MAPPLPLEKDRPQGDLSYPTGLSFRDLKAGASDAEPTSPEQREQLEKLLEASEEELLYRLGREIAPLESVAPTLWFVSSNDRFLPLALRLATRASFVRCSPDVGAGVPSDLVAALLVKQDLDKLCRCRAERAKEGGGS